MFVVSVVSGQLNWSWFLLSKLNRWKFYFLVNKHFFCGKNKLTAVIIVIVSYFASHSAVDSLYENKKIDEPNNTAYNGFATECHFDDSAHL